MWRQPTSPSPAFSAHAEPISQGHCRKCDIMKLSLTLPKGLMEKQLTKNSSYLMIFMRILVAICVRLCQV